MVNTSLASKAKVSTLVLCNTSSALNFRYKALERLRDRALMFRLCRDFFEARSVMEVDCPLIAPSAIDAHIDPIPVICGEKERRYLLTSPEFSMKRLLVEGSGDIYQLGHVFRDNEEGSRHRPEFTMVEWYRVGFQFEEMIAETLELLELFVGAKPRQDLSYEEAFLTTVGIHPNNSSESTLREVLESANALPEGDLCSDTLLDLIFATLVEPELGRDGFTVLLDFPPDKAELARTGERNGQLCVERFEVYLYGYELANGYGELSDPEEHRQRFEEQNRNRLLLGKAPIPMDEPFIEALKRGLPDCCGVAVGFDRLMMLRRGCDDISEILAL